MRSPIGGYSLQCCYGQNGTLVRDHQGGSRDASPPSVNFYAHVLRDLVPYVVCCKSSMGAGCSKYFTSRPSGDDAGYALQRPGEIQSSYRLERIKKSLPLNGRPKY